MVVLPKTKAETDFLQIRKKSIILLFSFTTINLTQANFAQPTLKKRKK